MKWREDHYSDRLLLTERILRLANAEFGPRLRGSSLSEYARGWGWEACLQTPYGKFWFDVPIEMLDADCDRILSDLWAFFVKRRKVAVFKDGCFWRVTYGPLEIGEFGSWGAAVSTACDHARDHQKHAHAG